MKAAQLFVKALENEGVEYIFGIPGEENIDVMDALLDSPITFVTCHHEQGAAFMADVYGRLTGRAGVCMSTLGPGATNLITGVADANMDRAPVVAIAGQGATTRLHKESHQILDQVSLFKPITKYATQILAPEIVSEVVRKAFKVAQAEKPGAAFIDFPENVAEMEVPAGKQPIRVQTAYTAHAPAAKLERAAELISAAKAPVILAGNGVIRQGADNALVTFAEMLHIPVANTFMAKGVVPFTNPVSLGTIGLKARDLPWFAFEKADVVICVGYDMVEYHPDMWNPNGDKTIIHIDGLAAEVDERYIVAVGVLGDISNSLRSIALKAKPQPAVPFGAVRRAIEQDRAEHSTDDAFPIKPQKIVWDLREALGPEDIAISDVGAHKMWMSRMYRAERPNTCIISNGFAAMGIAVPGAIAAKLVHPDRTVVAVTGDAGFMMNSQEIETALRMKTAIVILIWNDSEYGLITWHQLRHFGRPSHISFNNPDFVKYAESFGAKGYRVQRAEDLLPTLKQAIADDTVVVIDCQVDYGENMKLTNRLKALTSPL
ncbi:acetolactate synthase large subunit [Xenophilus arseniciresistens]|uniref:Acetolactate synthase large subunit n=1 Tax=Xenophilus arseniciresistens TaxID=1283306 RepID=A0AAE3N7C1_9BURK|nr:acetolactate synthase large subunit [Xenophilus arseniciresistens]MDA7416920.1 acetolactate synthase large subunit [Xenophilus arseniciresistens]